MDMHTEILARLSVTEFRNFRKAVAVLVRTGLSYAHAVEFLLNAMMENSRGRVRRVS